MQRRLQNGAGDLLVGPAHLEAIDRKANLKDVVPVRIGRNRQAAPLGANDQCPMVPNRAVNRQSADQGVSLAHRREDLDAIDAKTRVHREVKTDPRAIQGVNVNSAVADADAILDHPRAAPDEIAANRPAHHHSGPAANAVNRRARPRADDRRVALEIEKTILGRHHEVPAVDTTNRLVRRREATNHIMTLLIEVATLDRRVVPAANKARTSGHLTADRGVVMATSAHAMNMPIEDMVATSDRRHEALVPNAVTTLDRHTEAQAVVMVASAHAMNMPIEDMVATSDRRHVALVTNAVTTLDRRTEVQAVVMVASAHAMNMPIEDMVATSDLRHVALVTNAVTTLDRHTEAQAVVMGTSAHVVNLPIEDMVAISDHRHVAPDMNLAITSDMLIVARAEATVVVNSPIVGPVVNTVRGVAVNLAQWKEDGGMVILVLLIRLQGANQVATLALRLDVQGVMTVNAWDHRIVIPVTGSDPDHVGPVAIAAISEGHVLKDTVGALMIPAREVRASVT